MSTLKKALRVAGWVGLSIVVVVVLIGLSLGGLVELVMTPSDPFDAQSPPPAPDYATPQSWSALPEREDAADRSPTGAPAVNQLSAAADVFYVHPTSYVGARWNASTDDASTNDATDRGATGIQASPFNGCCAVYAPRYRQANTTAFYRHSPDGDRAIALGYTDVRRAFDAFNSRRGAGRPFILAAHSQGSVMAERLLYEAISGTDLRDQLVAAYLVGGRVTAAGLRERAPDIAACRSAEDIHCVVAWNARGPAYKPTKFELHRPDPRERLCTNPLSWRIDDASAPAELNLGAVFLERDDHAPRVGFTDARCVDGVLLVSPVAAAPRDIPSRALDYVMGAGNYHPIEFQLFFMNLRQNAAARVAAFIAAPR